MKAIVKNGQNHEMYLLIDIDITEQPYRLVNQILENHSSPEKIFGAANVQLLNDHAIGIKSVSMELETEGDSIVVDGENTIVEFILSHKKAFDSIEVPTFIINVDYSTESFYDPNKSRCDANGALLADYLKTLLSYGHDSFSVNPFFDEIGIAGADITVPIDELEDIQNDNVKESYSIHLDCRLDEGKSILRSFEYKSGFIPNGKLLEKVKRSILRNKFGFPNSQVSMFVEENDDNSGSRIIISCEYFTPEGVCDLDYSVEIYLFENVLETVIDELTKE